MRILTGYKTLCFISLMFALSCTSAQLETGPPREGKDTIFSPGARESRAEQQDDPVTANTIVFVIKDGKYYHRDGCQYLNPDKIKKELQDAAKDYAPCTFCKPPVWK